MSEITEKFCEECGKKSPIGVKFCKFCGIKSFYQPRSHQNAFSINYNCIKDPPKISQIIKFDGSNFEKNIDYIKFI